MTAKEKFLERPTATGAKLAEAWARSWFVTLLTLAALWPQTLWAAEVPTTGGQGSLGAIICNISYNLNAYPRVLGAIAYIMGAFLVVNGVLLLRKHFDNTNDSKVTKAVGALVAGAIFLSLPQFAGVLQHSLFGKGAGGAFGCVAGTTVSISNSGSDMSVIMQNFVKNIYKPMFNIVGALSIVLGITFIARGLLRASKAGSDPKTAPHVIVVNLLIGAVLISMGNMLPSMLQSIFGDSNVMQFPGVNWSAVSSGASGSTQTADNTVKACLAFVQVVGVISFLRGWLIVKSAVEGGGQATVPQGMTHVIGGTMAINIGAMVKIIDQTLGTGLIN